MKLPPELAGHRGVVLDTNFWIYFFDDDPLRGAWCEALLNEVVQGHFSAVVTPVTLAELSVAPMRRQRLDVVQEYRRVFASLPHISVAHLTATTGWAAGGLRAQYNLPLPDAMQLAAALLQHEPTLLTNDKDLVRVKEVRVLLLDDLRRRSCGT